MTQMPIKLPNEKSKPFDKVLEIVVPITQNLSPLPPFYALMIGLRSHTFNRVSMIPYKMPWPNNWYCRMNSTNTFKLASRLITSYMHVKNKKDPPISRWTLHPSPKHNCHWDSTRTHGPLSSRPRLTTHSGPKTYSFNRSPEEKPQRQQSLPLLWLCWTLGIQLPS